MNSTADTPGDTCPPQARGVFGAIFAAFILLGNLWVVIAASQDRSWGALWIAFVAAPVFNGGLLISGLVAIPFLKRRRAQFSLGRHLALTLGVPIVAFVVDIIAIGSMGLHGC